MIVSHITTFHGGWPILTMVLLLIISGCREQSPSQESDFAESDAAAKTNTAPDVSSDSVAGPQTNLSSSEQTERSSSSAIDPEAWRNAAFEGQLQIVGQGLDAGVHVNATDGNGRTALMLASFNGHDPVIQLLVDHDAKLDLQDAAGRTALMYAASGPNPGSVRILLNGGADPNLVDGEEQWTALMFAAAEGHDKVVQLLLDHGANPETSDIDGDTARDFAIDNGHSEVVQILQNHTQKSKQ